MVRVVGIDPGTKSFDLFGLDNDEIILDRSIPTENIIEDPGLISDIIKGTGADLVAGPSGFGVPITDIKDIGDSEIFLMSLIKKGDKKSNIGMRRTISSLRENNLPVVFIPGVIHLPTVPYHRKLNKIDMGTADKLCCAALGIRDHGLRHNKKYNETSFIMLEMGYGYTAAIAVKDGQVVDGIGGSSGNIGFVSLGCMDAELAYLLGGFNKELVFKGGVKTLSGTPEGLIENENAFNAYIEGAMKCILQLYASVKPEEVIVSGRLSRVEGIFDELNDRLEFPTLERLRGFQAKNVKEAPQGAALIASGLAGGQYKELVDIMKIKEAKGTSLDYILLPEIKGLREEYGV